MRTGAAQPMRWVTGWQDLNARHVVKSSFCIYASPEVLEETDIRLTVETENGARSKLLTVFPEISGRQRRVSFPVRGRRFRVIVESDGQAPWRLAGGLQIDMDTEEDG